MEHYRSMLINKTYWLESRILPYINQDTGVIDRSYVMVSGLIDNKSVMLDTPVSRDRMLIACNSMMIGLEQFLEGSHNITHYNDFPEFRKGVKQL